MVEPCKICDKKGEYNVQIGKKGDIIFCNTCAPIVAIGLKVLEDGGQITINF